jgi:2-iminoacetate synthase
MVLSLPSRKRLTPTRSQFGMIFPDQLDSLYSLLSCARPSSAEIIEVILRKAMLGDGLDLEDAAALLTAPSEWNDRIFDAASALNLKVKGKQITFYGVVYIHDFCINHCTYCGDSVHVCGYKRKLLSPDEFVEDVSTLLSHHALKEICFLMGEAPKRFNTEQLIQYLGLVPGIYREKIILNIPPLSSEDFKRVRAGVPNNRLHFRVFQETYDKDIYRREHLKGPKMDFEWRVNSQTRARQTGFDETGHGVLYGLNDKPDGALFDTLAMLAHARCLHADFGKWSQSMSFPRLQPAPGVKYSPPGSVDDDTLVRCVAVIKLAAPQIDTVITCRESAEFRRRIRTIVNIEDFAARPGPGGNVDPQTRQQMFLPDMRTGEEVREEMAHDGYKVQ